MKPFIVSSDWIYYSHGPGADSGYAMATELCEMAEVKKRISIPAERAELVREIVSQAELFGGTPEGDDEDKRITRQANRVIARGREWLRLLEKRESTGQS